MDFYEEFRIDEFYDDWAYNEEESFVWASLLKMPEGCLFIRHWEDREIFSNGCKSKEAVREAS